LLPWTNHKPANFHRENGPRTNKAMDACSSEQADIAYTKEPLP
jgi:hypothetical protein